MIPVYRSFIIKKIDPPAAEKGKIKKGKSARVQRANESRQAQPRQPETPHGRNC
jgi:hypothetical protein